MGAAAGKVALVNTTAPLTCGADCDGASAVVDFVGFGTTATDFAGAGAAPAPSATNSVSRNVTHDNTANNAGRLHGGCAEPHGLRHRLHHGHPPAGPDADREDHRRDPGPGGDLAARRRHRCHHQRRRHRRLPDRRLQGLYIQTPGTGGPVDPASDTTSDGIFVFQASGTFPTAVQVGNYVQVTGSVTEFFGLTQLNVAAADVVDLGAPPAAVTAATTNGWPATNAARESLEGMLYRPTGAYTVTNTFTTNQYGEVGLASGTKPLIQPTEVAKPGPGGIQRGRGRQRGPRGDPRRRVEHQLPRDQRRSARQRRPHPAVRLADRSRAGRRGGHLHQATSIVDFRNNAWKLPADRHGHRARQHRLAGHVHQHPDRGARRRVHRRRPTSRSPRSTCSTTSRRSAPTAPACAPLQGPRRRRHHRQRRLRPARRLGRRGPRAPADQDRQGDQRPRRRRRRPDGDRELRAARRADGRGARHARRRR